MPVRGNVVQAPKRGSTHNAHTAGSTRQPSNSTTARRQPTNETAQQRNALMSNDEMKEASRAVMQQHGWNKLPADPQA